MLGEHKIAPWRCGRSQRPFNTPTQTSSERLAPRSGYSMGFALIVYFLFSKCSKNTCKTWRHTTRSSAKGFRTASVPSESPHLPRPPSRRIRGMATAPDPEARTRPTPVGTLLPSPSPRGMQADSAAPSVVSRKVICSSLRVPSGEGVAPHSPGTPHGLCASARSKCPET